MELFGCRLFELKEPSSLRTCMRNIAHELLAGSGWINKADWARKVCLQCQVLSCVCESAFVCASACVRAHEEIYETAVEQSSEKLCEENPRHFRNSKVHYRAHKSPTLASIVFEHYYYCIITTFCCLLFVFVCWCVSLFRYLSVDSVPYPRI